MSVLFVDLVGFTSLSESREAEDVRGLLGRYFDAARKIVDRYGGTVEKFIGDAVMAVWGVPVAREDDAERAVRAALEVVDAVAVLGGEVGATGLQARAGVVTGQVAALENPGEGLVVGDRVNTASRVQSSAKAGSVLVDEVTRQVTSAAIDFADAGEHRVQGKADPLRLWRAVRVVSGAGGRERDTGLQAPFVGRDGDLRLVKELFHGVLERGSARLVAISGEAGVGKSRLRREFSYYLDGLARMVLWHSGRCLSYGDGAAYWALAEMVRQRLGISEDASSDDASAKLAAGLERWVPDPADRAFLSPRLGVLLGLAEPSLARAELFAGWRLFFERLAGHEPVVLVFEDMQRADAGLLEFVEQLLDWSADNPIFILTLARPELAATHAGWPAGRRGATTLGLEPLEDRAMRELLTGLVDGLPEEAVGQIIERAQGVPLYAIETVRNLADRGALIERDGRLFLDGALGELEVPASLGSLLAARLDALDPLERGLVKAMSAFGSTFPRPAAAALGDVDGERLDEVLAGLVRKQVLMIRTDRLSPDRGQYAFAQELLRTVAYGLLSRQERKPRHRAAAEYLQSVFANDGEEVAEVIAAHYLDAYRAAGEDPDAEELRHEALIALRRAAQRAAAIGAPEAAERLYQNAAELAGDEFERAALNRQAGEMALQSGRFDVAMNLLETAAAAHRAAGREQDVARLTPPIAEAMILRGHLGKAVERVVGALEALGGDRLDPDIGILNERLAQARSYAGDYDGALPALESALRIAEALSLPELLSTALSGKANVYLLTGRVDEARYLYAGAVDTAERHHLTNALDIAQSNLGNLAMQWDQPDATDRCAAALAGARRLGNRYGESIAAANLMSVYLETGDWEELARLAHELLDNHEDRSGAEYIRYPLVTLSTRQGQLDAARMHLGHVSGWQNSANMERRSVHEMLRITVQLAGEEPQDSLTRGLKMLPTALQTLGVAHEAVRYAWPCALQAALHLGRVTDARRLLELLADQPPGHIPPFLRAQLARGRGLTAAATADHAAVRAELTTAIEAFGGLAYPYWQAVCQTDLAAWLAEQGSGSEATALLDEASGVLEALGAAPALARAGQIAQTLGATVDSRARAVAAPADGSARNPSGRAVRDGV